MHAVRHHRQFIARLIAAVMLLAALAPGVSRAMAYAEGRIAPWSVVCSTTSALPGLAPGQARGDDPADGTDAATQHLLQHCALCHLQGDHPAPPPTPASMLVHMAVQRDGLPPLALQSPRPLHAWASPPGRAPPAA